MSHEHAFGPKLGQDSREEGQQLDTLQWDTLVCQLDAGEMHKRRSSPGTRDAERIDNLPPVLVLQELVLARGLVHSSQLVLIGCDEVGLVVGKDGELVLANAVKESGRLEDTGCFGVRDGFEGDFCSFSLECLHEMPCESAVPVGVHDGPFQIWHFFQENLLLE